MIIGPVSLYSKTPMTDINGQQFFVPERHAQAIKKALPLIQESNLPIKAAVLYGSCARREARFDSDVDICLVLQQKLTYEQHQELRELRNKALSLGEPEIGLSTITFEEWKHGTLTYIREIRRDGKILWENKNI